MLVFEREKERFDGEENTAVEMVGGSGIDGNENSEGWGFDGNLETEDERDDGW